MPRSSDLRRESVRLRVPTANCGAGPLRCDRQRSAYRPCDISGLTAFRHLHLANSPERSLAAHSWLREFAWATLRACSDAETYASRIDGAVDQWRSSLGTIRQGSALDLLIDILPGVPLLTVESAAGLIDRSDVATGAAINRLVEAGILTQRNIGKQRYRILEAPAILDLFASLERALASPTGDTETEPPVRSVPNRSPGDR